MAATGKQELSAMPVRSNGPKNCKRNLTPVACRLVVKYEYEWSQVSQYSGLEEVLSPAELVDRMRGGVVSRVHPLPLANICRCCSVANWQLLFQGWVWTVPIDMDTAGIVSAQIGKPKAGFRKCIDACV